jgi:uncharacterized MAPEG superfamily protein
MEPSVSLPTELLVLGWSVVLLLLHIGLQSVPATLELGSSWNAGPRDEERKPSSAIAGRAERALRNFQETYPAFIGLALALVVSGQAGGLGATGSLVWIFARVAYIPLYMLGIPYIRSLVWVGSVVGLVMMLIELLA